MVLFSFIRSGKVHTAKPGKVIPKEQFSELMQAHDIIHKAQQEVEEYKTDISREADRLKEKAREEGFQEGLSAFNAHLLQFDKQLQLIRMELQRQILPLALKAAKKIVGEQLTLAPETIVEIVIQAIGPVVQNHRFTIYVNKADKDLLEAHRGKIRDLLEQVQTLTIADRADVPLGGCIIETESGIINATLENQWRALEAAFAKYNSGP
jgi:type III secretion protein L